MRVVEVPRPHGFLLWRGKQTAIPCVEPLPAGEECLIVSDGEAFGTVTLGKAASMDAGEFERTEWTERHCTRREERKMWWPGVRTLYVQDVTEADWYEAGSVPVDVERDDKGLITDVSFKDVEPATSGEQDLISRAQRMPRLIMLSSDAVGLTGAKLYGQGSDLVSVDILATPLVPYFRGQLERALAAVFNVPEDSVAYTTEKATRLPLYWLALVRSPRFGIERTDGTPEFKCLDVDHLRRAWHKATSTEAKQMPYTMEDYPEQLDVLPDAAREVWINTYNAVFEESEDEDAARQAAWAAVNRAYERDEDGVWSEKQVSKTEDGQEFGASAYLYVPDPEKPTTWKLRIEETPGEVTRNQLGLTAAALGPGFRGRRAQLPAEDRRKAAKDLIAEYRKLDTADEDIPAYLWRLADMEAPEKAKAAVTLDDEINKVRDAFDRQFPTPGAPQPVYDYYWIQRSYKGFVIVEMGNGDLYKVLYTKRGDDVTFVPRDQWIKVEIDYQEVKEQSSGDVVVTDSNAPEPPDTKAGRRLRTDKVGLLVSLKDKLSGLGDMIAELLNWAEYADQETESIQSLFSKEAGVYTKEVNGQPWFFSWSANAFKDREEEIFSTAALERYVEEAEKKQDKGFFNFWHIPGTDYARKEWQAVVGRFLVEAGPYLEDEAGQKAKAFFEQYPDGHPDFAPEGWGSSVEYKYLPEERETGVYQWLWITRTSTLPRQAAANIWTEAGKGVPIMALDGERKKAAIALFGEEYVDRLITDAEKRTGDLEAAGIEHKENGEPEVEQEPVAAEEVVTEETETTEEEETESETEPTPVEVDIDALAGQLEKLFTADITPLAEGVADLATSLAEAMKRIDKLEKAEAQKSETEVPRFQLYLKRASEEPETVVQDGDALKESKPEETKAPLTDGSMASAFFPARK